MAEDPENLVLQILRDMRQDMATMHNDVATKNNIAELKADNKATNDRIDSLARTVAADLIETRKDLSDQIVGLRRAVVEYHSSVIGHGTIIAELEERVRRLEAHVGIGRD